jgi:hypothetical protein
MWEDVAEYNVNEYTMDQMRKNSKGEFMSGEQIWDLGMGARRKATDNCSGPLGKVIKFKTTKPPSNSGSDSSVKVEEDDLGLVEQLDSGGSDDLALADLLLMVFISNKKNCH